MLVQGSLEIALYSFINIRSAMIVIVPFLEEVQKEMTLAVGSRIRYRRLFEGWIDQSVVVSNEV